MKNIRNNTWYILSKTWKYEKRLIIIILFQIMIGVILPLATSTDWFVAAEIIQYSGKTEMNEKIIKKI